LETKHKQRDKTKLMEKLVYNKCAIKIFVWHGDEWCNLALFASVIAGLIFQYQLEEIRITKLEDVVFQGTVILFTSYRSNKAKKFLPQSWSPHVSWCFVHKFYMSLSCEVGW